MIILQTLKITKSFGIETILSDINITIQSQDRIGLVGINGAGKSTLLKIIAAKLLPDSGEIQIAKNAKIGYLAQDSGLETNNSIWDEMRGVFADLIEQEKYIRTLEAKMSDPNSTNNPNTYEKLLNEYANLTEEFREKGGYSYEAQIRGVLSGLGFQSFDYYNQRINTLSGGQKTRLALAKLLLEKPALLILDEPTNYLDVNTLTWLEGYLKSYPGAIFVVSHDRYFLDAIVNIIYELDRTKINKYSGNYTQYIDQKAAQLEIDLKNYEKQQAEISKLEDFVQKNIARASTTRRAQSKRKMLEKIERIERPTTKQKTTSFSFETDVQSGNNVLRVNNLSMGFNEKLLFENVSFDIYKQERVALIGPNGIGKTTLLKLLLKEGTEPIKGTIDYGSNVRIGYYDQEQDKLQMNKTIIDELWDEYPTMVESEVRTILGSFLFSGDDVYKLIKDLSGGERARVSLAKLILKKANFLILDEPTNHLDIFSREVLENALIEYNGTILFISHDRYFLNQISTRTIELTVNGIVDYLGNYDYYLEKKAEFEEAERVQVNGETDNSTKNQYEEDRKKQRLERQLKRKIEAIESEIEQHELTVSKLESELISPEVFSNHHLSMTKNEELNNLKNKIEQLLEEWELIQKELEIT